MKEFSVGGKRVETRLLMRHDDGDWAGYSYEWNDDADRRDAPAVGARRKDLGNGQTLVLPEPHRLPALPHASRGPHRSASRRCR